jgi:hypothetical protein
MIEGGMDDVKKHAPVDAHCNKLLALAHVEVNGQQVQLLELPICEHMTYPVNKLHYLQVGHS